MSNLLARTTTRGSTVVSFYYGSAIFMLTQSVSVQAPGPLLSPPSANPKVLRTQSRAFMSDDGLPQPIEFFIASDAAAIIEHTKRVLYLEDDDIAHISEGELHIHRLRRKEEGDQ